MILDDLSFQSGSDARDVGSLRGHMSRKTPVAIEFVKQLLDQHGFCAPSQRSHHQRNGAINTDANATDTHNNDAPVWREIDQAQMLLVGRALPSSVKRHCFAITTDFQINETDVGNILRTVLGRNCGVNEVAIASATEAALAATHRLSGVQGGYGAECVDDRGN